jgi:hypothetical protein
MKAKFIKIECKETIINLNKVKNKIMKELGYLKRVTDAYAVHVALKNFVGGKDGKKTDNKLHSKTS